ncbi:unnamed protein product [Parascedosporium putredinis]|uniref:Uncharacterized protein n=1 Tax=Parascedosporium putredinis TaxID=1442378 RepID=A0A9P1GXQ4_9PEZI|nr:unnamed protein product [Parascedosporium putredinis]CAI7990815.1 unnamed protein product [Parascedosporium putredinis]
MAEDFGGRKVTGQQNIFYTDDIYSTGGGLARLHSRPGSGHPTARVLTFTVVVTAAPTVRARKDRDSRLGSQAGLAQPSLPAQMGALADNQAALEGTGTVARVGSGPGSQVTPILPSGLEGPNAPTAPYCRHHSAPPQPGVSRVPRGHKVATPSESSTSEAPASSTVTSDTSSATPTPTASPQPECQEIDGNFENGVEDPWYISNQMTADSSTVLEYEPSDSGYAFALIPSQRDSSQVYLNQPLPTCSNTPITVTLQIRFFYEFAAEAVGCKITAGLAGSPTGAAEIIEDDTNQGAWLEYVGTPFEYTLQSYTLFTVALSCAGDAEPGNPAIHISNISVYP